MFIEVNYLSEQFMSDSYRPNTKYSIFERFLNNCSKLQNKKQVSPNQFIIDKKICYLVTLTHGYIGSSFIFVSISLYFK